MQIRIRYHLLGLASMLLLACSTDEPVSTSGSALAQEVSSGITLRSLSTRSWLVTGGDVLVEIAVDAAEDFLALEISLNGTSVSDDFVAVSNTRQQALLEGLPEGNSTLVASVIGTSRAQTLTLTNYPITGPIISGRHETPFQCQVRDFVLVTGANIGAQGDSDCSISTRVQYVYWSDQDEAFKPFITLPSGAFPADMAQITSPDGGMIPYIVRVETGTVNRAIYEVAMLHNPLSARIDPWNRSSNWNGKLVYTHGGGCRGGWNQQGDHTGGVMRRGLFELGYAVTSSTLNVFGQNCNDLLASETHIMVKERFIETYGVPDYTIATGVSGGSYQSHQTADNYPGVFDGIIVGLSFPDVTSSTIFTVADARLLHYYFNEINSEGFTSQQQAAVAGFGSFASIANLSRGAARLDPVFQLDIQDEEQGGEVSIQHMESIRYQASIPDGIRATVYDHTVNVYGRVGDSNVAQRPLDNVGVQYGLSALNEGVIDAQQFIDLNAGIGGFDRDMNHVAQRHTADAQASRRALESGRILSGGAGLASTPIIDYRRYTDHAENGDIHMIVHQFSTRERLRAVNGHSDNQVMVVGGRYGYTEEAPDLGQLFMEMDAWIVAVQGDQSQRDLAGKVVANKPGNLTDSCWDNSGAERVKIEEEQTFAGTSRCNELYPAYPTPRIGAGAPLANDVVSCELRPIEQADYAVTFTSEQLAQLSGVFPTGVCDWARGDASNARHQGTWASLGPSPINRLQ